jgi:Zn-finger nucleic acid-binding protein
MPTLKCPHCRNNLITINYQNIEVDRCSQCEGIWFDALEAEELKKIKGSENVDIGNYTKSEHLHHPQQQIKCPRCRGKMLQMLDIDQYSIWYKQCRQCRGIWLDSGDFRQFKLNFSAHNLTNLTKYIFSENI